jgi:hypothetical protein
MFLSNEECEPVLVRAKDGRLSRNSVPRSAINKDIRKENIEKPRRFG